MLCVVGKAFETRRANGVNYAPQDIGPATQLVALCSPWYSLSRCGLVIGNSFTSSKFDHSSKSRRSSSPRCGGLPGLGQGSLTQYAAKNVDRLRGADLCQRHHRRDTMAISGGKTYAQLSNASSATGNTALANQVELVFRGDTLRGLLLNAYAFGFMGQIALFGHRGFRAACDALPRAPRDPPLPSIDQRSASSCVVTREKVDGPGCWLARRRAIENTRALAFQAITLSHRFLDSPTKVRDIVKFFIVHAVPRSSPPRCSTRPMSRWCSPRPASR